MKIDYKQLSEPATCLLAVKSCVTRVLYFWCSSGILDVCFSKFVMQHVSYVMQNIHDLLERFFIFCLSYIEGERIL